jgi:heme-degrading monooxygenase HmoA
MAFTLQRATVKEYDAWKSVFDGHAEYRGESGSRGGRLYRSTENPNEVVVFLDWKSEDAARSFLESDYLRETLQEAGVQKHDVVFLEGVEEVEI